VIKGVKVFQNNATKEYSDLDVMQMMGRAGRPQFGVLMPSPTKILPLIVDFNRQTKKVSPLSSARPNSNRNTKLWQMELQSLKAHSTSTSMST
jgi:hypothetical protein